MPLMFRVPLVQFVRLVPLMGLVPLVISRRALFYIYAER